MPSIGSPDHQIPGQLQIGVRPRHVLEANRNLVAREPARREDGGALRPAGPAQLGRRCGRRQAQMGCGARDRVGGGERRLAHRSTRAQAPHQAISERHQPAVAVGGQGRSRVEDVDAAELLAQIKVGDPAAKPENAVSQHQLVEVVAGEAQPAALRMQVVAGHLERIGARGPRERSARPARGKGRRLSQRSSRHEQAGSQHERGPSTPPAYAQVQHRPPLSRFGQKVYSFSEGWRRGIERKRPRGAARGQSPRRMS